MNATEIIRQWLTDSGWTQAMLARRANLSPSTITRLFRGRSVGGESVEYALGELAAYRIERATYAAWAAGQTNAAPLRAVDLVTNRAA